MGMPRLCVWAEQTPFGQVSRLGGTLRGPVSRAAGGGTVADAPRS